MPMQNNTVRIVRIVVQTFVTVSVLLYLAYLTYEQLVQELAKPAA